MNIRTHLCSHKHTCTLMYTYTDTISTTKFTWEWVFAFSWRELFHLTNAGASAALCCGNCVITDNAKSYCSRAIIIHCCVYCIIAIHCSSSGWMVMCNYGLADCVIGGNREEMSLSCLPQAAGSLPARISPKPPPFPHFSSTAIDCLPEKVKVKGIIP